MSGGTMKVYTLAGMPGMKARTAVSNLSGAVRVLAESTSDGRPTSEDIDRVQAALAAFVEAADACGHTVMPVDMPPQYADLI